MRIPYRHIALLFLAAGIGLRLLLWWITPPQIALDNHFEPIDLILVTGAIPAKDACFQCYQPPVLYLLGAAVAKLFLLAGGNAAVLHKLLQLLNCCYGIATLPVLYLILKRIPLSEPARLLAFGMVCFLPRHIYLCALHGNDTISILAVALAVYGLLRLIEESGNWRWYLLQALLATLAIFTKYTALVVPLLGITTVGLLYGTGLLPSGTRLKAAAAVLVLLPLLLFGGYGLHNLRTYGKVLPWNDAIFDTARIQPRDPEPVSFVSFTPWQYIATPLLVPGQMHSFWTLIYSGMWYDTEPKYLYTVDRDLPWWRDYFKWLQGRQPYQGGPLPLSGTTLAEARVLLCGGLVVLALMAVGVWRLGIRVRAVDRDMRERVALHLFPLLFLANAAGIILLTLKAPVYSSMKASYFLISLPAFSVLLALGLEWSRRYRWLLVGSAAVLSLLFATTVIHILRIGTAVAFSLGW